MNKLTSTVTKIPSMVWNPVVGVTSTLFGASKYVVHKTQEITSYESLKTLEAYMDTLPPKYVEAQKEWADIKEHVHTRTQAKSSPQDYIGDLLVLGAVGVDLTLFYYLGKYMGRRQVQGIPNQRQS